ncbi:flagellar biosynthesis protein FlhF [Paenibacillus sacheonensis]|uniref:Flagellar biosynthesis protein FlhF n=1 Tax=Paenibacillus sacheonensis TaxID=742054 RepID=A0A7X4YMN1_9BACL|nr:flagellar biosynthesis protein FlhF [Paenibacillus sacheonensis]MBM7564628.1 flagellar biosynthesis protein FlhF [Paenibacillus sacheonensis]NBC69185.1 flagellar biosynthesis protein FlhF [Paenibacillus sacheonensis]
MKVKRYVVNALPEALPMIRSELGVDAVILNTKEIRIGGFLGMFGKKKTEVIAAVETNGSERATPPARSSSAPAKPAISPEAAASMAATLSAAVASREKAPASTAAARQSGAAVLSPERELIGTAAPAAVYAARTGAAQMAAGSTADPIESKARPAAPSVAAGTEQRKPRVTEDALIDEIRDMKQWIMRMSKQQQLSSRPEAVQSLVERLEEQEVSPAWIERLIDTVMTELKSNHADGDQPVPSRGEVWKLAEQALTAWLRGFEGFTIASDTRVIHFVGPTGVGKTTSIAKLAAEQTLKAGRKVGLITSDTYRIAAVDQLRTYATILNVPLEVVFSPSEVARAFKALEDRELIFMDTAGRNFRNELYVSEVNSLLQTGGQSETFLVLSLTGKFSDMSAVAGNFAKFGVDRVLYTKQDETSAVGAVLNLALEHGLKPTFIANGQTVPDDISAFQATAYVSQLLGDGHE